MSILTASNLSKYYGTDDIFSGIHLSIPRGARIGLVGMNGVGKTTLLRILLGEELPTEGSVNKAKNLSIGYLPQEAVLNSTRILWDECLIAMADLLELEKQMRAAEDAMAGDTQNEDLIERYGRLQGRFDRMGGFTYENTVERTLAGLGFQKADFEKPLNQLSGGQRTRAALAQLLLSEPDLMLLDEPTNHLDIQAMEWLEGFLKNWSGAAVLVSHDRYFLDQTVTVIWEMTPALEVYRGNYSAYLLQREERYESQLKEYEAQQEFIAKEEKFIRRNIAGQNTRQAQGRRTRLERLLEEAKLAPPKHSRRMRLDLQTAERSGDLVVRTYSLEVGYPDDGRVLIHVPDLVLRRRECAAVMGPNGAGKTTFLKTLLDKLRPLRGEVKLGASVRVGYFSQAHESLHPSMTLLQEVQHHAPKMHEPKARSYLATFLFTGDDVFKEVGILSGGERGRLALACLALQGANLLLLDEPTNHLDLPSQEILQRILTEFTGTVLLVSHDRYLVDAVATQIWEVLPAEQALRTFEGGYSELKAAIAECEVNRSDQTQQKNKPSRPQRAKKAGDRVSQKHLRNLEAHISRLEDQVAEVEKKLENPLDTSESIADLGRQYVELQDDLDKKWSEWEELFSD